MASSKIMDFFKVFKCDSYNRIQLGNDKSTITKIYEYLSKINCSPEDIKKLITNIAYLKKDSLNIPLFLELMCKSLGFQEEHDLDTITDVVREIHDMYAKNTTPIPLEEYIHAGEEEKMKKIFLNASNKYILKSFRSPNLLGPLADIKFAAAMVLEAKEYQDFINYIDNYEKYQETYSPLLLFHTYIRLREKLKEKSRLYWDLLLGNEYVVSLYKHNISIRQIYANNVFKRQRKDIDGKIDQLDIFNYEEEQPIDYKSIRTFQLCTIYNTNKVPAFKHEKDFILYFRNLEYNQENIILPKLKGNDNYLYNNY